MIKSQQVYKIVLHDYDYISKNIIKLTTFNNKYIILLFNNIFKHGHIKSNFLRYNRNKSGAFSTHC